MAYVYHRLSIHHGITWRSLYQVVIWAPEVINVEQVLYSKSEWMLVTIIPARLTIKEPCGGHIRQTRAREMLFYWCAVVRFRLCVWCPKCSDCPISSDEQRFLSRRTTLQHTFASCLIIFTRTRVKDCARRCPRRLWWYYYNSALKTLVDFKQNFQTDPLCTTDLSTIHS